jgi:hypothetical protein
MRYCASLVHRSVIPSFHWLWGPNPCSVLYYCSYLGCTWNDACSRLLFVSARRGFTQVKLFAIFYSKSLFLIKLRSSDFSSLFLDMNLIFASGVPLCSGELSDPLPSLVNCRLGPDDAPGLNAAYCWASYYPLGDLSGD